MFFILSKILMYAVMPLTIVCGFLIAAAIIKKQSLRKKLFVAGLALLLFFTNGFIANEAMRLWEVPVTPMKDITKTYAWGIVLTGVTKYDTGPTDRVYFGSGADRVTHTLQLYKMGKIKKILVSGGSGRLDAPERKEATEVAEALMLMGVPASDIVTESESRNTHESAVAVKKMLTGQAVPSECLLITSAFHLRRSIACYKKVGWDVDGFSVDFHATARKFHLDVLLVPSADALHDWHVLVKEWVGMVAYKVAGYI